MARQYCVKDVGKDVGKAYGRYLNVSFKQCVEVCTGIKGKSVKKAEKFLEDVQEKKEFVRLHRHKKQVPHRKHGVPGRYHVKACKEILKIVKNAVANADQAGLDSEKLFVAHAAAQKGPVYDRRRPKGRMGTASITTTHIEIMVKER